MTDRKSASAAWLIAVVLLVLFSAYMGAYYWAVEPLGYGNLSPFYSLRMTNSPYLYLQTSDSVVGRFFASAHYLDRRIRPHVWEPTP